MGDRRIGQAADCAAGFDGLLHRPRSRCATAFVRSGLGVESAALQRVYAVEGPLAAGLFAIVLVALLAFLRSQMRGLVEVAPDAGAQRPLDAASAALDPDRGTVRCVSAACYFTL
jgi:hypothetical protein